MAGDFDVAFFRRQFPALRRTVAGQSAVYFDGPAGSQVPQRVIDAVADYLAHTNANHDGRFITSRESDALLCAAHEAVADFLNAPEPESVVFGPNMTTLTLAFSRALARTWSEGDEILVTRIEHDANVTPWVLAARDAGVTVRHVEIRQDDCTLDLDDLEAKLSPRTRLVAVAGASNAVGTINPIREITRQVHEAGGEIFVDAVHLAPHQPIDVQAWGCDYLACSAYKFFGPHVGVLWGRRDRMAELPVYKLRPAPDDLPGRWMTGTQNHEGIAGVLAGVDYLADLGRRNAAGVSNRRDALLAAYEAIAKHERRLLARFLDGLKRIPSITVYGITDPSRFAERVPTVSFTHATRPSIEIADRLARQGIFVWHGNFYALPLTETLGLEPDGMVRIGLLHYNTTDEVDRLLAALGEIE